MLLKPSREILEALANLENNGNWTVVRRWLEASNDRVSDALSTAEQQLLMFRFQGGKQILKELLEYAREARSILNKT